MIFSDDEHKLFEELRSLSERLAEDKIYEKVIAEVEDAELDAVAKAKAFEEAEGDDQKARAFYIKHRVRRIRDLAAEYEIWVQQESVMRESIRKEQRDRAHHRKILSDNFVAGAMPPTVIQNAYRKEFSTFYSQWTFEDYARKYLPKSSAWRDFLKEIKLLD